MKDTLKKIVAITAICLIAAQSANAAQIKSMENTGIILCSDKPDFRPILG